MTQFCHPEFGCDCDKDSLTEAEKDFLRFTARHIESEYPATAETLLGIAERKAELS